MTHDIRELLTGIREWQAADAAVHQLWGSDKQDYETRDACIAAITQRDISTYAVCKSEHNGCTLAAFVALADQLDALEAKIAAALDACEETQGCLENIPMASYWHNSEAVSQIDGAQNANVEAIALLSEPTAASEGDA